jgi:hypothetical protein
VDDDARWKAESTLRASRLEHAVQDILRILHLPDMQSYGIYSTNVDQASQPLRPLPLDVQSSVVTRENPQESMLDEGSVVSAPTDALYEGTKLRNLRSDRLGDR